MIHLVRPSLIAVVVGVAFLPFAPARADIVGTVWENAGDPEDATDFAGNTTGPSANFLSPAINYCSDPAVQLMCSPTSAYNVSGFLNFPAFTNPTPGFDPNANLDNTFIQLQGNLYLNAGDNNFLVLHDDGVSLTFNGGASGFSEPDPTSATYTPFTITAPAAGTYQFTLNYTECCGAPAVLQWTYPDGVPIGSVPEPGYVALIGAGFPALLFYHRRRQKRNA
ncbi:MAG: hypothetical protein JO099_07355 [Acidobacteriia bacterium]|nr:hypothetical protein [Terriglobia bacterium]